MEEIVFTSELGKENIQRFLKKNLLRKISSGIYTSNLKDSIEDIIKRRWLDIIGVKYPNSILRDHWAFSLHRQLLEGKFEDIEL